MLGYSRNNIYYIEGHEIKYEKEYYYVNEIEWVRFKCNLGEFSINPMMDKSVLDKAFLRLIKSKKEKTQESSSQCKCLPRLNARGFLADEQICTCKPWDFTRDQSND